jgi:lipopolysaccharide transport system permease protein
VSRARDVEDAAWSTVVRADSRSDISLRELWAYRDLVLLLVHRDFTAQYKQTLLGPAWHVINPLLATAAFSVVFGGIARVPTDGRPAFLFYLAGYIPWAYFSRALGHVSNAYITNAHLMAKVYFPRLAVPIASLGSNLIAVSVQLVLLAALMGVYGSRHGGLVFTRWTLAIPLVLVLMGALGLGVGTVVAALSTRYKDLTHVVSFGTNLLMYATPVIYPASLVSPEHRFWLMLNPASPLIEAFRRGVLGVGTVTGPWMVYSAVVTAIVLALGLTLFGRASRTFVDTI